ncbi:MAG: glycogen/starch synthase, partial [Phycisphaeraceae bacterium]|nr:glycogen/starch synthase [Phycisphaeraceae bacterium]
MRVLMLGWEFPPFISGGLGTACHGLTKALDARGHEIVFVLPRAVDRSHASHIRLISPDRVQAGSSTGGQGAGGPGAMGEGGAAWGGAVGGVFGGEFGGPEQWAENPDAFSRTRFVGVAAGFR